MVGISAGRSQRLGVANGDRNSCRRDRARVRGAVLEVLLPHPAKLKHTVTAMKNAIFQPILTEAADAFVSKLPPSCTELSERG